MIRRIRVGLRLSTRLTPLGGILIGLIAAAPAVAQRGAADDVTQLVARVLPLFQAPT